MRLGSVCSVCSMSALAMYTLWCRGGSRWLCCSDRKEPVWIDAPSLDARSWVDVGRLASAGSFEGLG
jgi:hypothetical protein